MTRIAERKSLWHIHGLSENRGIVFGDEFAGLEDLTLATRGGTPVAVPFDISQRELNNVRSAALAHQLGLKSLDYIRREYVERGPQHTLRFPATYRYLLDASAQLKSAAREAAKGYHAIREKPDRPGLFGAGSALLRLFVSFRSAVFLLRNGMHFEFGLVGRLILEQIAWSYAVHQLVDDQMFALNPQSQITKLKEIVPSAGRLYGTLSEQGHIPPTISIRYLDFTNPADPGVHMTMYQYGGIDLTTLARLTDAYCVCIDVVAASIKGEWGAARIRQDGALSVSKQRPSLRLLRQVEKRVRALSGD